MTQEGNAEVLDEIQGKVDPESEIKKILKRAEDIKLRLTKMSKEETDLKKEMDELKTKIMAHFENTGTKSLKTTLFLFSLKTNKWPKFLDGKGKADVVALLQEEGLEEILSYNMKQLRSHVFQQLEEQGIDLDDIEISEVMEHIPGKLKEVITMIEVPDVVIRKC